jgi:hypothetical protein
VELLDDISQPISFGHVTRVLTIIRIALMLERFFLEQKSNRFFVFGLNAELKGRVSVFVDVVDVCASVDELARHFKIFLDQNVH